MPFAKHLYGDCLCTTRMETHIGRVDDSLPGDGKEKEISLRQSITSMHNLNKTKNSQLKQTSKELISPESNKRKGKSKLQNTSGTVKNAAHKKETISNIFISYFKE